MAHLAHNGGKWGEEIVCRILVRKAEGNNHFADRGLGERIILKWILKK